MVLLIALSKASEKKVKGKRTASRRKSVKHCRRVVNRRVSIAVSEKIKMISPTNVHCRSIRFPLEPVFDVFEIDASNSNDSGLHYTQNEMDRIAKERQEEADEIQQVIKANGTFEEDDDKTTVKGMEDLVYPEKAKARLQAIHNHAQRVLLRTQMEGLCQHERCNSAA